MTTAAEIEASKAAARRDAERSICRTKAVDGMARWQPRGMRIRKQLRGELVDAAMNAVESAGSDENRITPMAENEIRIRATQAARDKLSEVTAREHRLSVSWAGWIALQVFIRVALPIIVEWWLKRLEVQDAR
ncbi:MAG: hypothetical protein AAF449_12485 [Myxococcota bacterium]